MKVLPEIYYYSINGSKDLQIAEIETEHLDAEIIADEIIKFLNLEDYKETPIIEIFNLNKKSLGKFKIKTKLAPIHYSIKFKE